MQRESTSMSIPSLFPCAAKVKIPQLGSEDTNMSFKTKTPRAIPPSMLFRSMSVKPAPVSRDYLHRISENLAFDENVVRDRCFHMLPYDPKYFYEAISPGDIIPQPPKMKIPPGRHDARGTDVRHMPCNLTKSMKPHLKPLKRKIMEKAYQMRQDAIKKSDLAEMLQSGVRDTDKEEDVGEGFFLTETKPSVIKKKETKDAETKKKVSIIEKEKSEIKAKDDIEGEKLKDVTKHKEKAEVSKDIKETVEETKEAEKTIKEKEKKTEEVESIGKDSSELSLPPMDDYDWDAYVLSAMSARTANWLVHEKMPPSEEKDKLKKLLQAWYGKPKHTDLLSEEEEEREGEKKDGKEQKPKKKWKKKEATLLERVYKLDLGPQPVALDPYSDQNLAPFYRQPAGLRRVQKIADREEAGVINATAANIKTKSYAPPPAPTIRDSFNPRLENTLYDTDNLFQEEWLTGNEQLHELHGDKTKIVMSSNNKYRKSMQKEMPQAPEKWYPETEQEKQEYHKHKIPSMKKVQKGLKRWKELPEQIDDTVNMMPPGYDPEFHRSPDPYTRRVARQNQALMKVVDEWRAQWHLTGQLVDSKPDDLIKDMADIQMHVRRKAIATIQKASVYRPPDKITEFGGYTEADTEPIEFPERLFVALECLLDDSEPRVQVAAAITLYSLERPSEKGRKILLEALVGNNSVDRWAAAQCLAHYGDCNSLVVGEVIQQVCTTEDTVKHETAIALLGKLSVFSPLVHCMVAEQLNSVSWRFKVIACKILPTLHGTINKDITYKLIDLMWNDWHEDVRKSAAQCLGKTSHGREVHEELKKRMIEGNESTRLEAISKVGHLGIMTAKLLPVFLKCFDDEYISVRSEACVTAGNLQIEDEQVLDKLVQLATFDPIWKVKALAFQAFGKIGIVTEQITQTLLWAVRYEDNPGVRAEACHTLMELKLKTEEVAEVLQERFLVESSPIVRDEIAQTLQMFGISATEDMDMVSQIKNEVRKLCTRNNIAAQIHINDKDDEKRENLRRMIYESEKELKRRLPADKACPYRTMQLRATINKYRHVHFVPSVYIYSQNKFTKEHEGEQEPIMQRIRSMSQAGSRADMPNIIESHDSSPTPSRDAAVFTPTADEELDKILSREDTSARTSPETQTYSTTPQQKSQAGTDEASLKDREEMDSSRAKSRMDRISEEQRDSPSQQRDSGSQLSQSALDDSEKEFDTENEKSEEKMSGDRPTSIVKFSSQLTVTDIPGRARSTLTPNEDIARLSRISSIAQSGSEGVKAFSRDAVREREKINTVARDTFDGLDARYFDMVDDLYQVDNAYEIIVRGLDLLPMGGSTEKIQNIMVLPGMSNPDLAAVGQADESFIVDSLDNRSMTIEQAEDSIPVDSVDDYKSIRTDDSKAQFFVTEPDDTEEDPILPDQEPDLPNVTEHDKSGDHD